MKKAFKILLKILGISALGFVLLLGGVSLWIYYNQDKIYQNLIDALNETQRGYTEVRQVDVSPFENFPYISIGLHDLSFYPDKSKSCEPIYHFEHVYAGFDIWDILRAEYTIRAIKVRDGFIHLVLNEEGQLNLALAKGMDELLAEEPEEADDALHLDLQSVEVINVQLREDNLQSNKVIDLMIADAKANLSSISDFMRIGLEGDFVLTEYTADETTFFKDKPFSLSQRLTYDVVGGMMIIFPGKMGLEYGHLNLEGSIDFANKLNLNLELSGQKRNFDVLLSFAPNEVAEVLSNFRNEGDVFFRGTISGPAIDAEPAIDLELGCENTFFFHKDKSKAIKDMAFKGRFHTGANNNLETAELIIENLRGVPETGEFRGTFRVINFLDPIVSVDFHADIKLSNFQSFYDPDWLEDASGYVRIDITINEFVDQDSLIHIASKMEDGTLSRIEFRDANVKLSDYHHKLEKMRGKMVLDGDNLLLEDLFCQVASSDLRMSARLGQLNALAHKQAAIVDFTLHLESQNLDMADLLPVEYQSDSVAWTRERLQDLVADFDLLTSSEDLESFTLLPRLEMDIRRFQARLDGFDQQLKGISGKVLSSDERLHLQKLQIDIGDNDLTLDILADNPAFLKSEQSRDSIHFHLSAYSKRIHFKDFLYYRGTPLLDEEIQKELGEERITGLRFEGDGYLFPASLSAPAPRAYCNIEELSVRINDLPKLGRARGRFRSDTTGSLFIENFYAQLGRSDYRADLELHHLLDSLADQRIITGRLGGDLWDFDEYIAYAESQKSAKQDDSKADSLSQAEAHQADFNVFALPFPTLDVEMEVGKIIKNRYLLSDLEGHFRASPDHMLWIDTLHFFAAGGHVGIRGYLNGSDKDDLYLKGILKLDNVDIDQVFIKMDNFGQDYLVSEQLHGRISGQIDVKSRLYPDLSPKLDKTEASMQMKIKEGRLENFAPMEALSEFMGNRDVRNIRFGDMENTLQYKDGVLKVPQMKIASTLGYIHLAGQQDIEDHIDYEIQVPLSLVKSAGWNMMRSRLSGKRKKEQEQEMARVDEEIISEQRGLIRKYMTFNVSGTVDKFEVGLGKNRNIEEKP